MAHNKKKQSTWSWKKNRDKHQTKNPKGPTGGRPGRSTTGKKGQKYS